MGKFVRDADYVWKIGAGMLRLYPDAQYGYEVGEYVDARGFVSVYRQPDLLMLEVVQGGKCHRRTWRGPHGKNTLRRLAREMLDELTDPQGKADG